MKIAAPVEDFTPKLLTILRNGYSMADFRADFLAGLTVAIVALPLAMAFGIASGASPDKGLITAIVAGFLISLLGGSRVQIGGPTGAFIVVISGVIAQHGYDGLILATLLAGFMLIIAGFLRCGKILQFIPAPVITGFTAGIAVIIASSQVRDFFGLQMQTVPAGFIAKWMAYFESAGSISLASALVGIVSLAIIIGFRRFMPKIPGLLVAVFFSSVLVTLFHIPLETIGSRFGHIPSNLPAPQIPAFTKAWEVLPSACIIAFLAGIEALLSAAVADGLTGFRHRSNQELVCQGIANIASALFGGLPATGAIARTATNIRAGGRTPVAGMLHAVFLLVFMLGASGLMKFIPMAALAAVLFMVAWGMSESGRFITILRAGGEGRIILLITFLLTVLVDLTTGIASGIAAAYAIKLFKLRRG